MSCLLPDGSLTREAQKLTYTSSCSRQAVSAHFPSFLGRVFLSMEPDECQGRHVLPSDPKIQARGSVHGTPDTSGGFETTI